MISRILITPGEPGGIGPDICLDLAEQYWPNTEIILVTDPELIASRAKLLERDIQIQLVDTDLPRSTLEHSEVDTSNSRNRLKIIPVKASNPLIIGKALPENGPFLLKCLDIAMEWCQNGLADALVTGPINKASINESGIPFTGHTEYLQESCKQDLVVMMLATDELKVALVTTHLPLSQVPAAITKDRLNGILSILTQSMKDDFALPQARILVAGLNPHAGENGYLGREEIDTIEPVISEWQQKGHQIIGPLPADTLYAKHWLKQADATLAMYHDQGLPVLKHSGFGRAANITLGLPIVRTSVDHGTALDLAGSGKADSGSLFQAIKIAIEISANRMALIN